MSVQAGLSGGRGGGILSAASITTVGAVTLPFTGENHAVSIVGFTAVSLGILVFIVHLALRLYNRIVVR